MFMIKKFYILLIIGMIFVGCGYKADPVYIPDKNKLKTKN